MSRQDREALGSMNGELEWQSGRVTVAGEERRKNMRIRKEDERKRPTQGTCEQDLQHPALVLVLALLLLRHPELPYSKLNLTTYSPPCP